MTNYQHENKLAAEWLLEYAERKTRYSNQLAEFTPLAATAYKPTPGGTDISQPTQNKAISLAQLEADRLWLITIEDTERTLSEKRRAFLDAWRWASSQPQEIGRPGWVDMTLARYSDWFYRRYGSTSYPNRKTIFRWKDEIINIAVRIAIKRGAL